jgi:cytochrome c peroxidase
MFKYCLILSIAVLGMLIPSFTKKEKVDNQMGTALKVNHYYQDRLQFFYNHILLLDSLTSQKTVEEDLKPAFLATREAFKSSEFLLCYMNSDEVRRINGANITTNEYHQMTPMEEKPPHGLQVIEDLIYNPEEGTYDELIHEIQLLKELIGITIQRNKEEFILQAKEYNLSIWDAIRLEVFRIETMGITGFDVPESQNSLPETKQALISLKEVIGFYLPAFQEKKQKKLHFQGVTLLDSTILYLSENNDFNTFNRLEFMTNYLHPLSKWINHSISVLEYTYPVNVRPIDNNASYVFDEQFFNPAFFAPDITPEKIILGKKLFNDPIFSSDGSRSCATCHVSSKGLADGLVKNHSVDGKQLLARNTPSLWNVAYQTKFFYDSKVKRLEMQVLDVIHNPLEMGGDINRIAQQLKENPEYADLFEKAYKGNITKTTTVNAISNYLRSLNSFNSRFDRYIRGERTILSQSEINGFNIFAGKGKCATCHFAPLFNGLLPPYYKDNESEILGVPDHAGTPAILDADLGKYNTTKLELHRFSFKTVSIRNVELTAPYMHNGVFLTLEDVVEFYEKGGGKGQGMELESQTLPDGKLKLTDQEKKDLVQFMKSLTDSKE